MIEFLLVEWQAFQIFVNKVYAFIFPEYPPIGMFVLIISVVLFIFYLMKAGFSPAFRLASTIFVMVTFCLFAIHHMGKLLHINLLFS